MFPIVYIIPATHMLFLYFFSTIFLFLCTVGRISPMFLPLLLFFTIGYRSMPLPILIDSTLVSPPCFLSYYFSIKGYLPFFHYTKLFPLTFFQLLIFSTFDSMYISYEAVDILSNFYRISGCGPLHPLQNRWLQNCIQSKPVWSPLLDCKNTYCKNIANICNR